MQTTSISKESYIVGYFAACYHEMLGQGQDPVEAFQFTLKNMNEILESSGYTMTEEKINEYNKINIELNNLCERIINGC